MPISECRIFIRHLALVIWHSHDRACRTAVGHKNSQPIDTMDHIFAKKVLDDTHPTKRLPWGSRQCRVNRSLRTSRRIISLYRQRPWTGAVGSDEPFKPLNLTYSLFKELALISTRPCEPHLVSAIPPNAGELVVVTFPTANLLKFGSST